LFVAPPLLRRDTLRPPRASAGLRSVHPNLFRSLDV
jgi:hypothetical protein